MGMNDTNDLRKKNGLMHPSVDKVLVIEGTHAASHAVRLAKVQVIAAYPITPQTGVVEKLSEIVSHRELNAKFIKVESEHSAMACCIGASISGARAFTATSSQGLALMHELLHWAAGSRLPIVMVNVNRAMAPPWSIYVDHNDSLSQRDTGWIQFYAESNQEVLDTVLQAYKIAETVSLPIMINLDAFVLSHTSEPVAIPKQEVVDEFLPERKALFKVDPAEPHAFGALIGPEAYMEMRYKLFQAMEDAREVIRRVDSEYSEKFGRSYGGLVEEYCMEDAEIVLMTSATAVSTARIAVDELRSLGFPVGLMKVRAFRPFPVDEIRELAQRVHKIGVMDRNISFGATGMIYQETKAVLYNASVRPKLFGFIAGLGGRDITPETIKDIYSYLLNHDAPESETIWVGLKSGQEVRPEGGNASSAAFGQNENV
ncbi:MAG: pyruvate ferredoxin oxidoreductase [Bacteroidetes bacterium]|jgi:pyruvate/2-oxoacid:ferredoxin oxidoreductase alpha subunit|nr:pyruvate ferredoxin oxidoreductase [Bacteroidota bacterium]